VKTSLLPSNTPLLLEPSELYSQYEYAKFIGVPPFEPFPGPIRGLDSPPLLIRCPTRLFLPNQSHETAILPINKHGGGLSVRETLHRIFRTLKASQPFRRGIVSGTTREHASGSQLPCCAHRPVRSMVFTKNRTGFLLRPHSQTSAVKAREGPTPRTGDQAGR
jgi:hypothetical protein